jgi:hypothetical protein
MINTLDTNNKVLDLETVLTTLKKQKNILDKFEIKTLALFGSIARNEGTENSDLDFLVEFKGRATFNGYMDLKFYLEDLFNKPVDLVTFKSLKPIIKNSVLAEAIYVKKSETLS